MSIPKNKYLCPVLDLYCYEWSNPRKEKLIGCGVIELRIWFSNKF